MVKVVFIAILSTVILLSYQNCAVYQSEGREQLNHYLSGGLNGCLPFLDINDVADITGITTNNIILRKTSDALGNFGCTITDRSGASGRSSIECQVGENEKNKAQNSYNPTPAESYDDIYNSAAYCPAATQATAPFQCEDVANPARAGIHSDLLVSGTGSVNFLAYFKLNVTGDGKFSNVQSSEEYNYSGFGYAAYIGPSTSVSVFATDNERGVECQLTFPRKVSDSNITILSARQADYNEIRLSTSTVPNDIDKLKYLGIRILSNY